MEMKEFSARVVTFKLAAALEKYELDLRALAPAWVETDAFRRLQQQFGELGILGASLPRLAVSWMDVLVSRARLLQSLCNCGAPVMAALQEHLVAVESLRTRCLRLLGADGAALA